MESLSYLSRIICSLIYRVVAARVSIHDRLIVSDRVVGGTEEGSFAYEAQEKREADLSSRDLSYGA